MWAKFFTFLFFCNFHQNGYIHSLEIEKPMIKLNCHRKRNEVYFTGKNNRFPFLDIFSGYLKNTH